jgi:hypothetical protein
MRDNTKFVYIDGLGKGLQLAIRFGDYSAARLYGMKLRAQLDALPKKVAPGGNDLPWVNQRLAEAEACLAGNREAAAALLAPTHSKPAWWPESSSPATMPASTDDEVKYLEKQLARQMTQVQKSQKIRIKPGPQPE